MSLWNRMLLLLSTNFSQFMHCPTTRHWLAIKRLLRCLHGIIHYGLFVKENSSLSLHIFHDADWAKECWYCTSTSTYIVFWCQSYLTELKEAKYSMIASIASENSKKLNTISLSWIWCHHYNIATIYCDNVGLIYLCYSSFLSWMKHILLIYAAVMTTSK